MQLTPSVISPMNIWL